MLKPFMTLVMVLLPSWAAAQFCPNNPVPECEDKACKCSTEGTMVSDPVDIANGNSFQRLEDISLKSLGEEVSLLRSYTSHDDTWMSVGPVEGPAMPFGSSPTWSESLRWWHSFFAFARDINDGWEHVFEVRALDGKWSQFKGCTPLPLLRHQ